MSETKRQEVFGLPIEITDAIGPGTAIVGYYPKPERPNMSIDEYAAQCARHFTKMRLEPEE